jgi:hypothetical protein
MRELPNDQIANRGRQTEPQAEGPRPVAEKQADDIGIVGKLQRVRFGSGNAVTHSIRVAANNKLLETAILGRARLITGGQRPDSSNPENAKHNGHLAVGSVGAMR